MLDPDVWVTSNTSVHSTSTNTPHTIPNWPDFPLRSAQLPGDSWEINPPVKIDSARCSFHVGGTWKKSDHSFLFEDLKSQFSSNAFPQIQNKPWLLLPPCAQHLYICSRACMLESIDLDRCPHDTSDWKARLHLHRSVIGLLRGRTAH